METPKVTRNRARDLRRKLDLPEVLLWRALRNRQLSDLRFRRQHPIGVYCLDFYCAEARLAVEVDGYSHDVGDAPARDERRDAWLEEQGITTLRIQARDVLGRLDDVLLTILAAVRG